MPERIVVYTAIFGGYEGLLPQRPIEGVDFVCFTDTALRARPWNIRKTVSTEDDPRRAARERKVLPHRFLSEYDISIWIDGNYLVVGDIRRLIADRLGACNMLVFDHNQTENDRRNCLYREYEAIIDMGAAGRTLKDDPEVMRRQIERYRREGYPEENGLIFSSVVVRRHNAPDVADTMKLWWKEISNGSKRDQLSFDYAAWRTGVTFGVVDGNVRRNRWFYQIGIHRKDYRGKLFRYRLKRLLGLIRHS